MLVGLVRLALLTIAAVVLASCGGGDGGGGSDAASTTDEATWRHDVNAVCVKNKAEVTKLAEKVQAEGLTGDSGLATYLERSIPVESRLLDELADVPAPAALKAGYQRFVTRLRDAIGWTRDMVAAIRAGNANDPELTTRAARLAADTRPFATQHRLTQCLPNQS